MSNQTERTRRRNSAQKQELLSRFHQSQLTQAEFVRGEGICLATLQRYLKGAAAGRVEPGGRLIEIECAGAKPNPAGRREAYRVYFHAGLNLEIPAGFCAAEVASLLEVISTMGAR